MNRSWLVLALAGLIIFPMAGCKPADEAVDAPLMKNPPPKPEWMHGTPALTPGGAGGGGGGRRRRGGGPNADASKGDAKKDDAAKTDASKSDGKKDDGAKADASTKASPTGEDSKADASKTGKQ